MAPQKTVEIYTTSNCPYCLRAKKLLSDKGVEFREINVEDDAERQKLIDKADGARTVPQIFIDGELLPGGYDGLHSRNLAGELDKILGLS